MQAGCADLRYVLIRLSSVICVGNKGMTMPITAAGGLVLLYLTPYLAPGGARWRGWMEYDRKTDRLRFAACSKQSAVQRMFIAS